MQSVCCCVSYIYSHVVLSFIKYIDMVHVVIIMIVNIPLLL